MTQRAPLCSSASLISESQLSHWEFVFTQKAGGETAARPLKSPRREFPSKLSRIDTLNYVSRQPELTASVPRSATTLHTPVCLLDQTSCYQQGGLLIFCNHLCTNSAANDSPAFHSQL